VQQCAGGCDDIEVHLVHTGFFGTADARRQCRSYVVLYALSRLVRSIDLMEVDSG